MKFFMLQSHLGFVFLISFSLCLGGCSLGTELKQYHHLKDEKFPSLQHVPCVSEKEQKKGNELLKKSYLCDRKRLENERNRLKTNPLLSSD
jgi:hypothetical protein